MHWSRTILHDAGRPFAGLALALVAALSAPTVSPTALHAQAGSGSGAGSAAGEAGAQTAPADTLPTGRVEGAVFDSTAMSPLAGARVAVLGTSVMEEADDQGRFVLEDVPAGLRPVTFFHPRLQELGISAPSSGVEVLPDGTRRVALAIPSQATLLKAWCAAEVSGPGYTPAAGFVRDSITGVPLPRATVTFTTISGATRTVAGRTDESGYYRICNVPAGARVTMRVNFGRNTAPPIPLQVPEDGALFTDRIMTLSAIGEIRGTVADYETKRPLEGARVRILGEEGKEQLTDDDGKFFITDLPPGMHLVETEYLGYATRRDSVTIFSDEAVLVEVPLTTDAIQIAGMTVTARARVGDIFADVGRRRDYLSRPEVERLLPRVQNVGQLLQAAAFPALSVRPVTMADGRSEGQGYCVEHNRVRSGAATCRMITMFVNGLELPDPARFIMELDPTTVETVELLDPQQGQFRYGAKGVNGVVIITTRTGR